MASTHYEKATEALEAFSHAVDRNNRNAEYEHGLLADALIHALLDVGTQLAAIKRALDPLVAIQGDG